MVLTVLDKPTTCDDCGVCCMHAEALTPLRSSTLPDELRKRFERARDSLRFQNEAIRDMTPCIEVRREARV